jgi:YfiH family protein
MIEHPLLPHAVSTTASARAATLRPRVSCGRARCTARASSSPHECARGIDADAVVACAPHAPIGVVTADCVPVLAASADGRAVAAIHAGWRGLAAGVIDAGIDALRRAHRRQPLRAVIGPHIGRCCYEIDVRFFDALRHFDADLDAAPDASRPGHHLLDLGALSRAALVRAGVSPSEIGVLRHRCTSCDARASTPTARRGARGSTRALDCLSDP